MTSAEENAFLDGVISKLRFENDDSLTAAEIEKLASVSIASLSKQSTLLDIEPPINVCGDTHGKFKALRSLLNNVGWPPEFRYLFLGDYVDRGKRNVEVICLLLAMKCRYPDACYLLRGNHEDACMNLAFGFKKECVDRYGAGIWQALTNVFAYLPLCAVIAGRIFCVHGGISPGLKSLDTIRQVHRPIRTIPDEGFICDLLWSDPSDLTRFWTRNTERDISYIFGEDALADFCRQLDLDMVIRGHEDVDGAVCAFGKRRQLLTVHTCPYLDSGRRHMGMVSVDKKLCCQLIAFEFMSLAETVRQVVALLNEKMKQKKFKLSNAREIDRIVSKLESEVTTEFKLKYYGSQQLNHVIQVTAGSRLLLRSVCPEGATVEWNANGFNGIGYTLTALLDQGNVGGSQGPVPVTNPV